MTRANAIRWLGAPLRLVILAVLGVYRGTLGQIVGGRCRFHPTCSAYAIEAVHVHGALRGGALGAWRVLRCSPLTAGGIDPVPAPRTTRRATASYGSGNGRTASYDQAATR